jgi:5'-3' exonuclease
LVPKVGTRQEIIYDPDKVVVDYGVPPSRITHLRALVGDPSDNFKGIERVPRKLLASLIDAHGSLEGLIASNLSGTTKSQYEKIRAFESQARLYLQLMTLQVEVECPITEASPDVEEASSRLSKMEIQSNSILSSFFSKSSHGFVKTN